MTRRLIAAALSGFMLVGGAAIVAAPAQAIVTWEE